MLDNNFHLFIYDKFYSISHSLDSTTVSKVNEFKFLLSVPSKIAIADQTTSANLTAEAKVISYIMQKIYLLYTAFYFSLKDSAAHFRITVSTYAA